MNLKLQRVVADQLEALRATSWVGLLAIPLVGAPLPDLDWSGLIKLKISTMLPGPLVGVPVRPAV